MDGLLPDATACSWLQTLSRSARADGSKELAGACETLSIPHDLATPQRPQTNGVSERAVRRLLEETRAVLLANGLSHRWLAEAVRSHRLSRILRDPADETSLRTIYVASATLRDNLSHVVRRRSTSRH
jgi:hypothetical protein